MKKISSKEMEETKGGLLFELLAIAVMLAGVIIGLYVGGEIGSLF